MPGIARSIVDLIGSTPLLELNRMTSGAGCRILVKLESFNPSSSVKDRAALFMIEAAEKNGLLGDGAVIVEPTSGNTGIGLACVCASKGYRLKLTMPDSMSMERRRLLAALGAQVVLTPGAGGMRGAIDRAREIVECEENHLMLQQFENPANPEAHYATTGPEIWEASGGAVDIFVAGVGTGGTLTGTARFLKEKKPSVTIVAVEPAESSVLSGGEPANHGIQGIGAGFIPGVYDDRFVDEVLRVETDRAFETARRLARQEGLLVGISSGANVWAAMQVAARSGNEGRTLVTIAPDTGERYLSTALFS